MKLFEPLQLLVDSWRLLARGVCRQYWRCDDKLSIVVASIQYFACKCSEQRLRFQYNFVVQQSVLLALQLQQRSPRLSDAMPSLT